MSSGKNPLVLMMALSMPGAASAIGLGDIHVDSALNERFAAEIDIVGASALELTDLQAAVANRETFLRYGVDRPAFLSSATFKVTQDSQGRPVLSVRSTESFTEPLVDFLVDLRWNHGELVRQYTLLLDPPGFGPAYRTAEATRTVTAASVPSGPAVPDVPAAPAAATPIVATRAQTTARRIDPPSDQPNSASAAGTARKTTQITVGAKATLRGIAWRVGERSESDLQRMMIAIFRANPSAFDGNINRLHRGAVLAIPSRAQSAAISVAEAEREVHAQMAAWHSPARVAGATLSSTVAAKTSDAPAGETLGRRVQSLEQELSDMKGRLQSEQDQLLDLQRQTEHGEKPPQTAGASQTAGSSQPTGTPQTIAAPQTAKPLQAAEAPHADSRSSLPAILAALGLLGAAFGGLYSRFRRRAPMATGARNEGDVPAADAVTIDAPAAGIAAADTTAIDTVAIDTAAGDVTLADSGAVEAITAVPGGGLGGAQGPQRHPAGEIAQARAQDSAQIDDSGDAEALMRAIEEAHADDATYPMLPIMVAEPISAAPVSAARSEAAVRGSSHAAAYEPTVSLRVDTVNLRMDTTRLDYNLLDLDLTAQHVQMPSVLNEHAVVKERRTNLADVLKLAIEREPDRHDLRMKLLELYYAAAATNRKAFLEVVQKFARDRDHLQADQWDKIAYMGRQIASENSLFAEESAEDDDLADCA